MAEYIDIENAKSLIEAAIEDNWELDYTLKRLKEVNSADVAPVVHAKWIIDNSERSEHGTTVWVWKCHCSNCQKDPLDFVSGSENWWTYLDSLPKICSNCGAKMDKE